MNRFVGIRGGEGPLASGASQQLAALAGQGELPIEDLQRMMVGDYQIGDLLILLDNANK